MAQRRPTASEVLGDNFGGSRGSVAPLQISAPECPGWDRLSELSLIVESPPLRVGPPGHESFVRLADVEDDPNQVLVDCEEEYDQERQANIKKEVETSADDDVTTVDPNESLMEELAKEVDLQRLIHKCLRSSVKQTRTADRAVRISGLRSLRSLHGPRLSVAANSNRDSDEDDEDDVPDD